MSYTTILAEIKTILDAVTGIGQTYDYIRRPQHPDRAKDDFVTGSTFHVWMITRASMGRLAGEEIGETGNQITRQHEFHLHGYYAVGTFGTTEKTFQALCDTIMNDFDSETNLQPGNVLDWAQPAELIEFEDIMFHGTFCHHAVIALFPFEEVSP